MTKGVSEKFDEHERDTARRDYPQAVVDGTKRTTKIAKVVVPGEIRTESGTRPAITRDLIDKMRDALPHHSPASTEDAHSRPTIELTTVKLTVDEQGQPTGIDPSSLAQAAMTIATPAPLLRPTPTTSVTTSARVERSQTAGWVIGIILAGLVLMVSAAGAAGFFFGRRSHH